MCGCCSLLFALLATSLLLFLAAGGPDLCRLHQLQDDALLLFGVLHGHSLPHLLDLASVRRFGFLFHVLTFLPSLLLEIELLKFLVFLAHLLALLPLAKSLLVVVGLVAAQVVLDLTRFLQSKLVEAEFKVDDCTLVETPFAEQVHELAAKLLVQLVVCQIDAQQRGVLSEGLDHVLYSDGILSFVRQVVRLQVQVSQGCVFRQSEGEGFSGLKAEAVAFELQLAQSLVRKQGARQILTLFVLDALSAQVQGGERAVVGHDLGDNLGARAT